jgi:hypothetical protein
MHRLFTAILVSLIIFVSFAHSEEPYVPKENEELYGIWVNQEYNTTTVHARWDWNSDGTWASYPKTTGEPNWEGPYSITEKWTDAEGNVWYKVKWEDKWLALKGFGLIKISDSGNTIEANYSYGDYPAKIDPNQGFWEYAGIHYRK